MNEVWAVWPCVNAILAEAASQVWRMAGYRTAVLLDGDRLASVPSADLVLAGGGWQGFPKAVNTLCRAVPGDVVVVVGHDVCPDRHHTPEDIEADFLTRFHDTYGVMQPTGDQFGAYLKCATSPWIGRAFIEKSYEGLGPYWPEYFHYFCDQELQDKATRDQAFQQRSDLLQYHDHWQRQDPHGRPSHLTKALKAWEAGRDLYRRRRAAGFPSKVV